MRIGISLLWLVRGYGGLETYARGLLAGLAEVDQRNHFVLFTNPQNHASFGALPHRFRRRLCPLPARSRVTWRLTEQLLLARYAAQEQLDLLHLPDDMTPLRRVCPTVVTIHDVNFYSLSDRIPRSVIRLSEAWVRRSAERADAIITVSNFSREQITACLGVPGGRIAVIHNAPAIRARPPQARWAPLARRLGISRPYLVSFADGAPHKNLGTLLRAFAPLAERYRLQLVVVGRERPGRAPRGAREPGAEVVFAGYLGEDDLSLTLANARLLVFPSLHEGFGLPVVEAMEAGVPVTCSDTSALPEVAGDAALFFSPLDAGAMARAITRLHTDDDLRRALIARGYRRAQQFSWARTALQTLRVYERVAQSQQRRGAPPAAGEERPALRADRAS